VASRSGNDATMCQEISRRPILSVITGNGDLPFCTGKSVLNAQVPESGGACSNGRVRKGRKKCFEKMHFRRLPKKQFAIKSQISGRMHQRRSNSRSTYIGGMVWTLGMYQFKCNIYTHSSGRGFRQCALKLLEYRWNLDGMHMFIKI
jgi:hypothetical protein